MHFLKMKIEKKVGFIPAVLLSYDFFPYLDTIPPYQTLYLLGDHGSNDEKEEEGTGLDIMILYNYKNKDNDTYRQDDSSTLNSTS